MSYSDALLARAIKGIVLLVGTPSVVAAFVANDTGATATAGDRDVSAACCVPSFADVLYPGLPEQPKPRQRWLANGERKCRPFGGR